jgi:CheY-like chemotaxis protein
MQSYKNQLTVLLVGDNLADQEIKIFTLRRAGYNVVTACGGNEGFRQTRRKRPDLIICEMDLPGLTGVEFCKMVRADRYLRTTPFIFVGESDDSNIERMDEALAAGADDYLPEYFDSQYLAAKVAWLIDKKYSVQNIKEQYMTERSRQVRITNVLKETSVLMRDLDTELKTDGLRKKHRAAEEISIDQRIDLGIGLIGAIANLLEEQAEAMNMWESTTSARSIRA